MAFGEKQRRIGQLEGQVGHLEAELTGLQPWIGLAQTIRNTAAEHAATMDLDTAIGLAVHDTAEDQRRALVLAAFNRLDPERQLEMLATTFGDGVLKEALEEERQRRLSLTDSGLALDLLVREAREHRRFRPSDLPKDAKVELFLYDKGKLDPYTAHGHKLPDPRGNVAPRTSWTRHIKGIAVGDGDIAVHNDTITGNTVHQKYHYLYADHQKMSLHAPADDSNEQPLYYNVGVRVPRPKKRDGYIHMDLDLGPVFVNDVDIFDVTVSERES